MMATTAFETGDRGVPETNLHRTPKRQHKSAFPLCPGAPRRARPLPAWAFASVPDTDSDTQMPTAPFWTKGKPLETFQFGDPNFKSEAFALPKLPKLLSSLPVLGEKRRIVEHLSPYARQIPIRTDSSQLCEDSFGPARKRTRLCVPRQLKFDASLKELPSVSRPAMTDAVVPECQPTDADT